MTNAPHLLPGLARRATGTARSSCSTRWPYDGLTDAFDGLSMGESTERHNARLGISREEQDEFAARSQQRAARGDQGRRCSTRRSSPVEVTAAQGRPVVFSEDEGVRADTTAESLAQAAAGVRRRRHDHRRLVVADLRRRRRAWS